MQKRTLGRGLEVSALGLGCMGMSEFYGSTNDAESLKVLDHAIELGVTFLDTADMYGRSHNERLIGNFVSSRKPNIIIATKFGIVRGNDDRSRGVDNSPVYARKCCENSLKRLQVDCIDLYYVHRVDRTRPIEEVMSALSDLVKEGKICHIGLCEVNATTIKRAHAVHPITAVQTEYSLWSQDVEKEVLPVCRELGIGFVPYSPLGRGFLTGTLTAEKKYDADDFRGYLPRFTGDNLVANQKIVMAVRSMAQKKGCSPAQVALAWLLAQSQDIVPIPGTKRIKYLEENVAAANVEMSKDDLDDLASAMDQYKAQGERYSPEGMATLDT